MTKNQPRAPKGTSIGGQWVRLAGLMKAEGGFTFDHKAGSVPKTGIVVGVPSASGKDWKSLPHGSTSAADIEAFAAEFSDELAKPNRAIGGWSNADPGEGEVRDALDVVEVHTDKQTAAKAAKAGNQDGVFDMENGYKSTSDLLKEVSAGLSLSILTPFTTDLSAPDHVATNRRTGEVAFWKQILPMESINYTAKDGSRQSIDFSEEYLADLAKMDGIDKIGFLLADKNNAHTMDPERWRGDVVKMEVRKDVEKPGLYGKIIFPSREAANAVLNNPELGVSARIREGIQKSDGTTVERGIIHVLGTLDPQVSGMSPWEPATADLSNDPNEVLDLSAEEYSMTKPAEVTAKELADYTEEDIDAMNEEELDAFLAQFTPGLDGTVVADATEEVVEAEEPDAAEVVTPDSSKHEAAKELVGAGADMSKIEQDIELANGRAAYAETQARDALDRLAKAEWKGEREAYLAAGVPPHMLDLAAPVLERANDMVIDLSVSEEDDADLNLSEIVRGLLGAAKGTVDLSAEAGHSGTFKAGDGEDPDADLLDQWDAQV